MSMNRPFGRSWGKFFVTSYIYTSAVLQFFWFWTAMQDTFTDGVMSVWIITPMTFLSIFGFYLAYKYWNNAR